MSNGNNLADDTQSADARADALSDWLAAVLGTRDYALAPASEDASFRRYFRDRKILDLVLTPKIQTVRGRHWRCIVPFDRQERGHGRRNFSLPEALDLKHLRTKSGCRTLADAWIA